MIRNRKVQLGIGLLLSALFLYLALRPVSLPDLAQALQTVNWLWAIPVVGITFLSMYLRAVRWRWLMRPEGNFTAGRLFGPMMAGFGINSIFPGRLGEFARAYILARGERLSAAAVFATIVVERIFDSVVLLVLLPVALASTRIDPGFTISYGQFTVTHADIEGLAHKLAVMCGVLSIGAVLMMWGPSRRLVQGVIARVPLVPRHLRDALVRLLDNFARGFASLRDARSWVVVTLQTVAIWLTVGWSFQVMAYGFEGMSM
ncbi:MAG: flippase-like domain-containing protein, partial [Candidatus Sumerlaeaceae bacterium]|nr:flippase-like domain-containing protein [Candidatus Sumerlaeaceae bacterium]